MTPPVLSPRPAPPAPRPPRLARAAAVVAGVAATWRRHPGALVLVSCLWGAAFARVALGAMPVVPLLVNWTPSLPYTVARVRDRAAPARGDYVIYAFAGAAHARYPGLRGQAFFKQVRGVPGDVISVRGRDVYLNGVFVAHAKPVAHDGWALAVIAPQRIPPGQYFVLGSHADSFDSRYRDSGLVPAAAVRARVTPLW